MLKPLFCNSNIIKIENAKYTKYECLTISSSFNYQQFVTLNQSQPNLGVSYIITTY